MTESLAEETAVVPSDDAVKPAVGERPVSKVLACAVAGVLFCAFLGVDAITPSALRSRDEWPQAILIGICIAQVNLIALWAAMAPGNIVVRISWAMLLGTAMWYALVLGHRIAGGMIFSDAVLLGLSVLTGLIVLQIPLWIAKKIFRWRLAGWAADPDQIALEDRQFNIRHLLLAMFLLSVALAPLRQALPPYTDDPFDFRGYILALLVVGAVFNLLVTMPCVWWAFVSRANLLLVAIGWLFYCALLTGLEIPIIYAIDGPPPGHTVEAFFLFYLLNITQCAVVLGTLLIFRAIGFRLVRMPAVR